MIKLTLATLVVALAAGCATPSKDRLESRRSEMWVGDAIRQASLNRAIVTQRTLYPYHFVTGSERLNELGRRDLGVLAKHFHEYGGSLNLASGGAPLALYAAREASVRAELQELGFDEGQVAISDGVPGGEGTSSERLISILGDREATDARATIGDLIGN